MVAWKRNKLGIPPALTAEEVAIMMARIDRDNGLVETEGFTVWTMMKELKDWKVWEFASLIMFNVSITSPFLTAHGANGCEERGPLCLLLFPSHYLATGTWL